jgi:ABC-type uncharacterized transport system permease subunit
MRSGAGFMQLQTQVSADLISVVQAAVIAFVAAPSVIGWLVRNRAAAHEMHITQRETKHMVTG